MANPESRNQIRRCANAARPDAIVCTGRSDYPNQVNNVLGFPFIFRGALDVQARAINEEMKVAAAKALAALAHEDVPDSVLNAYNLTALKFGRDYIIPKPLDPRVMLWVSPAVAEAAMQSGVARKHDRSRRVSRAAGRAARLRACACGATSSTKRRPRPSASSSRKAKNPPSCAPPPYIADEAHRAADLARAAGDHSEESAGTWACTSLRRSSIPTPTFAWPKYAQAYYELRQRRGLTLEPRAAAHRTNRISLA